MYIDALYFGKRQNVGLTLTTEMLDEKYTITDIGVKSSIATPWNENT